MSVEHIETAEVGLFMGKPPPGCLERTRPPLPVHILHLGRPGAVATHQLQTKKAQGEVLGLVLEYRPTKVCTQGKKS